MASWNLKLGKNAICKNNKIMYKIKAQDEDEKDDKNKEENEKLIFVSFFL